MGYNKKTLKEYVKKWSVFKHPFSTEQFKNYSRTSGINSPDFVPDNIFFWIIEPTLNKLKTHHAFTDKNIYERLFPAEYFPKGILHCINNTFYDPRFNPISSLTQDSLNKLLTGLPGNYCKAIPGYGGWQKYSVFQESERGIC